jgi:hypothetical protein
MVVVIILTRAHEAPPTQQTWIAWLDAKPVTRHGRGDVQAQPPELETQRGAVRRALAPLAVVQIGAQRAIVPLGAAVGVARTNTTERTGVRALVVSWIVRERQRQSELPCV